MFGSDPGIACWVSAALNATNLTHLWIRTKTVMPIFNDIITLNNVLLHDSNSTEHTACCKCPNADCKVASEPFSLNLVQSGNQDTNVKHI